MSGEMILLVDDEPNVGLISISLSSNALLINKRA